METLNDDFLIISIIAAVGLCFHRIIRACLYSRIKTVKCGDCINIEQTPISENLVAGILKEADDNI